MSKSVSMGKGLTKWFFSLGIHLRIVIVSLIGLVLLWGFVTPFYLEFLKYLEQVEVSGWWVVIISGVGLAIFAKFGKNLLKV